MAMFQGYIDKKNAVNPVLSYMGDTELKEELAKAVNRSNVLMANHEVTPQNTDTRTMVGVNCLVHTNRAIMLQNEMLIRQNDEIIRLLKMMGGEGQ